MTDMARPATRRTCAGRAALTAVLLVALPGGLLAQATAVTCASKPGERQHYPADTSGGVAIAGSHGEAACLLGKTWGYDDEGVWVADGCGGEFQLGVVPPVGAATPVPTPPGPAPNERGATRPEGATGARGDLGCVRPRQGLPRRKGKCRRAVHQRVRARAAT